MPLRICPGCRQNVDRDAPRCQAHGEHGEEDAHGRRQDIGAQQVLRAHGGQGTHGVEEQIRCREEAPRENRPQDRTETLARYLHTPERVSALGRRASAHVGSP